LQSNREENPPRNIQRILDFKEVSRFRGRKWLRRLYKLRGSHVSKEACRLRGSLISERVSWLRGRFGHLEGLHPQVQVGKKHLLGMIGRCHGLRRPHRRLKGKRPLGVVFLPWRIHLFQ
jgi:hypothetical protein